MRTRLNRNIVVAGVLAAATLASAPALAQSSASGRFDQPLGSRKAAIVRKESGEGGGRASTRMSIVQTENDDSYELTIAGDEVTARINGREVPKERIRCDGYRVELLDEDGQVVRTFTTRIAGVSGGEGFTRVTLRGMEPLAFVDPVLPAAPLVPSAPPPKVMLGLTMADSDDEGETGVSVARVLGGLPADKAGIRKGDVIIAVDGERPVSTLKIREILAKKQPGEAIVVRVSRDGEEKDVRVELQKFEAARLEIPGPPVAIARGKLADADGALLEAMRRHQALRAGGEALMFGPGGDRIEIFSTPSSPKQVADMEKRLAELGEKLSRLDERLGQLERKLDRLRE